MKEADYILVLIGEKTYSSKWMKWEIDRAQMDDTKLKFTAVKIETTNKAYNIFWFNLILFVTSIAK